MSGKKVKPFEELGTVYKKHKDEITNVVIYFVQGILFVLTLIVAFVVLLATGIFTF